MPPTPSRQTYRIKSTDNALTLPGRTFFPKGTYISQPPKLPNPFTQGTGTQASGLSGALGASSAMYPTAPGINTTGFTPPSYNPSLLQQRGRGYGAGQPGQFQGVPGAFYQNKFPNSPGDMIQNITAQRPLSSAYNTDDSWYRPTAPATQPLTPPGLVTTPIGTGSEEFMNTKFMQANVANGTAFEKQLRWDPDRKKYVQLGKLINEGRLNVKTGRLSRKKRGRDEEPAAAAVQPVQVAQPVQSVQQQVQMPSIANAFVSFRA